MKPWFRKRRFGWGWTPTRWQGWVVVLCALVLIIVASALIERVTVFVAVLVAITSLLGLVSWLRSEERLRGR